MSWALRCCCCSTRRLTLTEAGALFHQRSVALLKDAERLQDDVRANHAGLTGELRITTTPEYGSQVVVPLLARFSQQHPDLRVRHVSSSCTPTLSRSALT
jgi:DNA-binding transcriptional LysR family regulator